MKKDIPASSIYGVCSKHPNHSMINCPMCEMENDELSDNIVNQIQDSLIKIDLINEIEKWSQKYDISFQLWGLGNNNVFIQRDHVELHSSGGYETVTEAMKEALLWIYKVNRVPNKDRLINPKNNDMKEIEPKTRARIIVRPAYTSDGEVYETASVRWIGALYIDGKKIHETIDFDCESAAYIGIAKHIQWHQNKYGRTIFLTQNQEK